MAVPTLRPSCLGSTFDSAPPNSKKKTKSNQTKHGRTPCIFNLAASYWLPVTRGAVKKKTKNTHTPKLPKLGFSLLIFLLKKKHRMETVTSFSDCKTRPVLEMCRKSMAQTRSIRSRPFHMNNSEILAMIPKFKKKTAAFSIRSRRFLLHGTSVKERTSR